MSLRNRFATLLSAVIIFAGAVIWWGIRPLYESALIEERLLQFNQLHQNKMNAANDLSRVWLSVLRDGQRVLNEDLNQVQHNLNPLFELVPDLLAFRLENVQNGEFFELKRASLERFSFDDIPNLSKLALPQNESISFRWSQDRNAILLSMAIDLTEEPLQFHAAFYTENLLQRFRTDSSVGKTYGLIGQQRVDLNSGLSTTVSEGNFPEADVLIRTRENNAEVLTYSRMEFFPLSVYSILDTRVISGPVARLFYQVLSILLGTGIFLFIAGWYMLGLVARPVRDIVSDLSGFTEYDFSTRVRTSTLAEFKPISEALETIRIKLADYQRRNVDQLIVEEERNKLLLNFATEMVVLENETGEIRFQNQQVVEFLHRLGESHFAWNDLLRNPFIRIDKEERNQETVGGLELKRINMEWALPEEQLVEREEEHIPIQRFFKVHRLEIFQSGSPAGFMTLLVDQTKFHEMDRIRNEMISVIVHELRNPVTGALGLIDLARDEEETPEERAEYFDLIKSSMRTMIGLINRFLDISRLESRTVEIEKETLDVRLELEAVRAEFLPQLRNAKLSLNIHNDGVNHVFASSTLFKDALKNIVSNAIKYGDAYRTIQMQVTQETPAQGESYGVFISVTDFGFGISPEYLSKVFDKFFRIKKYQVKKGTGLGLAYVKEIMELHGGWIKAESNSKIGTRFTLFFPST